MSKRPAKLMNIGNMLAWTVQAKDYVSSVIALAEAIKTDSMRDDRLQAWNCIACFYGSRGGVAGAAFTNQACMSCGKDQIYSSTNTDALCMECAKNHSLCKHCGGDIGMRTQRRIWPKK